MFLRFVNFYRQFIQSFHRIAASVTSILWTKSSSATSTSISVDRINKVVGCKVIIEGSSKKSRTGFFILEAKLAFAELRQAFSLVLILHHFDLKYEIWIKTNASGHTIGRIFNQLTLDNLCQSYPIDLLSQKLILVDTWYKTYNGKLLAIVEVFKTWRYYLEAYKYEDSVLTKYNNLRRFMNMNNLSFKQFC